jgi:glucose-1-phosphate adenylyltransferase
VADSLVSPGARVHGEVRRSVIGPGVVVEQGAVVSNSVVFADAVVRSGARVDWAIVDERCEIAEEAVVGRPGARGTSDPDEVTIVGRDSAVGVELGAGARLEPGTTAR